MVRDVRNMPGHGSRGNERTASIILQLLARRRKTTVRVLPPENRTSSLCAVEDRVQVGRNDTLVVRALAIDHPALRPGNSGVGDEDV